VFQTIRYRLLLSYLAVLTVILGVFAIAVRTTFAHSLKQDLEHRVAVLAEVASGALDLESEELKVDDADLLLNSNQAVQWFDLEGKLVGQRGNNPLTLPVNPKQKAQSQTLPDPAEGVTLPVREEEKNNQLIGYVRASESLGELHETLQQLDLGLGGGVFLALVLSGVGGIWLTHQAMQPIEKSFRRLQQFTADASHELRNPLMAIKSNAAVALKYAEHIRALDAEKFRAIASATTQMTALTEDLLVLARTDQVPAPAQNRVNLTALLEDLVYLYRAEAEVKQIDLKGQILEHLEVLGDLVQLNRLFTNLISNALRYTLEQGLIEIQTHREGSQILVNVRDTGVGMAPDHLEQIFDRFWRADRSRSQGSGFGLGLAIAQGIAQNHGGLITVTSQLSVGSCFTVRLPVNGSSKTGEICK
jgi:two-component system, OmpR family, manganese sensing sensor histidine kinase